MSKPNKKAAHAGSRGAASAMTTENQQTNNTTTRRQTKQARILAEFAVGRSLNRFEAERIGEHVLHTTVSKIERLGIRVSRRIEVVPGYGGNPTRVCRYWLDDDHRERAAALLGLA